MSSMKMLSEDMFVMKMGELLAWYINFQFKFFDVDENGNKKKTLQYMLWYEAFENFNDNDFDLLVSGYMRDNVYYPSSPTSILEYARKTIVANHKIDTDKAWLYVKGLIAKYGTIGETVFMSGELRTINRLENELKKHDDKKLFMVYEIMKSKLRTLNTDNEPYVRKEFFEEYERLLKDEVKSSVNDGSLKIDTNSSNKNKLIGE